ncbi:hypothetical protein P170DRAFT_509225 [Aspergillus steynii IBT 23096]|uniref:Uncharacterized protein n=1 Tax=Aspergillus steynii IBT 23096 TaxID=1392250 RepID=A0A2I2GE69_9EURO|nr:uncharacterized protein P170DRAFT_509225 [Aspergillus steynii IBT 23096]PLB51196.1 hypothetical protein P170DRAFT_509225 [Aspergillus steynii IBT 23096]
MASFNREGSWSTRSGQGLEQHPQTARFPPHISYGPNGRRPRGNRNKRRGGSGHDEDRHQQNSSRPFDPRASHNAAASNHTQQQARRSGVRNYPTKPQGENRVQRPPHRNQNQNPNRNNNRKFNNVFIPRAGNSKGRRPQTRCLIDPDGDVVMKDVSERFRQEIHREDPDSDVEMIDVFLPLEHPLIPLVQAAARSAPPNARKNRNNKRFGRRDADGDTLMLDAPPL